MKNGELRGIQILATRLEDAVPVILNVKSVQRSADGEEDTVEFVTDGQMRRSGARCVLDYEESELTGLGGVHTTFVSEPGRMSVERSGAVESRMIFERGQKHISLYETPCGVMTVGTVAMELSDETDPAGGRLFVDYRIDIENAFAGRNSIEFIITPMNEGKGGNAE